MIADAVARRAEELAGRGVAFVTATVVRAQSPTSARPGDVALVQGDGTVDGFVGGVCAEHSVRLYSLRVLETGEALLLRIMPDGPGVAEADAASEGRDLASEGREVASEEGAVTVQNPCLSGGAIEIFLEAVLPAPRVLVSGETPIAAAVRRLGPELGLEVVAVRNGVPAPAAGDLALVVAAHGRDELGILRRGLDAGLPYVGLVASRKRGTGVIEELRADGAADERLEALDVPAGMGIGAETPAEIALAILARIVAVRRGGFVPAPARAGAPPVVAIDPVCGMTVVAVAGTPSVEYDGETVYFCCAACQATFEAEHAIPAT
jgi:xanthine dehydrogenase accessory factor